jgi:hypothetical protein
VLTGPAIFTGSPQAAAANAFLGERAQPAEAWNHARDIAA